MFRLQPPPQETRNIRDYYNCIWDLFKNVSWMAPSVSADNGDAGVTLTAGPGIATTQVWNSPITAARTITLSTTNMPNGAKFRIVRTAAATGAFNLTVDPTGINKTLAAGQWCDVECNGSGVWIETASGSL